MLPDLMKSSKYQRDGQGPECTIERYGKKFEIRLVQSLDEKTIQEVQELMEDTFGEEEVDPIIVLKMGMDGKLLDGSKDVARYRVYIARDEAGKIQSIYTGGTVGMDIPSIESEAMFMGSYGITRPEAQRQGIVRELYISSMMQAAADAHVEGKKLSVIAGECTWSSEKAWNAVGRLRVYVETAPNEYSELRYVQPALDFDPKTGLPTEGAGEAPEHIMMDFLGSEPDKERISAAVESMYKWCNAWPRGEFESEAAYDAHVQYVADIRKEFNSFLNANGPLRLLTPVEREELRANGVVINEYTEADHADDSPENA
jgi:hypothetical protein